MQTLSNRQSRRCHDRQFTVHVADRFVFASLKLLSIRPQFDIGLAVSLPFTPPDIACRGTTGKLGFRTLTSLSEGASFEMSIPGPARFCEAPAERGRSETLMGNRLVNFQDYRSRAKWSKGGNSLIRGEVKPIPVALHDARSIPRFALALPARVGRRPSSHQ
ncbi:hypothetical protein P171DRAFT_85286 [Karstenula rhodostoma CBS 690.94]|uniref:Uncharacterized protein n=1 Tax=Karstenula rhodostoma CBS 690.94 TaxID=1392251 RepID=A0A9P4PDD5_9PLEO|nr:hypothetical protein P171DRAFT_85286 [Karstenula rhodostoma CBS 690.94]